MNYTSPALWIFWSSSWKILACNSKGSGHLIHVVQKSVKLEFRMGTMIHNSARVKLEQIFHYLLNYLFHEAIHLFTPVNECAPVPVPVFQSLGVSQHDEAAIRSCQGHIHPPPVTEKSDPSLTIRSYCRKYYQISLPPLVGAVQESTSVVCVVEAACVQKAVARGND